MAVIWCWIDDVVVCCKNKTSLILILAWRVTKISLLDIRESNQFFQWNSKFWSQTAQRSRASTTVEGLSPMSLKSAVIADLEDPLFHNTTPTLLPLKGPAHTYVSHQSSSLIRTSNKNHNSLQTSNNLNFIIILNSTLLQILCSGVTLWNKSKWVIKHYL